jgi:hypothetical protein
MTRPTARRHRSAGRRQGVGAERSSRGRGGDPAQAQERAWCPAAALGPSGHLWQGQESGRSPVLPPPQPTARARPSRRRHPPGPRPGRPTPPGSAPERRGSPRGVRRLSGPRCCSARWRIAARPAVRVPAQRRRLMRSSTRGHRGGGRDPCRRLRWPRRRKVPARPLRPRRQATLAGRSAAHAQDGVRGSRATPPGVTLNRDQWIS